MVYTTSSIGKGNGMEKHTDQNLSPRSGSISRVSRNVLPLISSPARRNFKLGKTATKAYSDVVAFLTKDIALPQSLTLPTRDQTKTKDTTKEKEKERKQLRRLVRRSNDLLATATTVFPLQLFPDKITIDRTKVTIVRRSFFFTHEVMSIRIEDILNVSTSVGPFFGSITLASRIMSSEDHFTINFFWRDDAIRLKHIIQGYVIAQHNNIKTSHLSRDELIKTLTELGHDSNA